MDIDVAMTGCASYFWEVHKSSMVSITLHRVEKGRVTPKQGLIGVGYNQTRSSPRWAPNMAKPRTRKANTSIKHGSKQA